VIALVDTNVLVYRYDPRFSEKQASATELLRRGIADNSLRLAHQAVIEFVAATTRTLARHGPLLPPADARREAEELLGTFPILYPNEQLVRSALRAMPAYQLSWFDAHMWAFADHYGIDVLYSEDFEHDRLYGRVRILNPFR
jgi:predicted nucleic acid-binding protein